MCKCRPFLGDCHKVAPRALTIVDAQWPYYGRKCKERASFACGPFRSFGMITTYLDILLHAHVHRSLLFFIITWHFVYICFSTCMSYFTLSFSSHFIFFCTSWPFKFFCHVASMYVLFFFYYFFHVRPLHASHFSTFSYSFAHFNSNMLLCIFTSFVNLSIFTILHLLYVCISHVSFQHAFPSVLSFLGVAIVSR